ncbi:dihydrolipoamide acetyltransferase family protein [Brevibacillus formosus]|uniref:Dihydrolipoamide acetyltransferase component of pyruvate dehydrogenase complex n=1 Tax=Brevibacillus formosus TaxID=54913 RepID=A0A837KU60_9BACL|nr:dihydrolipoamide acetyltransferase family protein [Brevibacillus formosus]KLI00472.1 branched-chain alpha-keto acid dehydrogenase subunit E2 [Brevibacillus formosus]MED1958785.1 dihydrolipoamide acetyltransferase family protein [Brevibacillus formosus]PSJ92469.1 2-oxo acid dehydrogenase subunit E2 [Brevibacillus formosus]GED57859.1 dihydrolipoamide acetyltransferase component of pyruvate dehydrogenase complex [Brevibacillus formosus]
MAVEVLMPKMGMAMKEGTVSHWNKQVGDLVSKGEVIASISSEKIEADLEAPANGVLLKIVVSEWEGVPPGTVIGYIGHPNEQIAEETAATATFETAAPEKKPEEPVASTKSATIAASPASAKEVKISPVARKLAEAAGLPMESLIGTGPVGRITKEDVEKAIADREAKQAVAAEDDRPPAVAVEETMEQLPVTGMRKVIASRMMASLQESAQLTITTRADVTDLIALQKKMNEVTQKEHDMKLTLTDLIARATVLALQRHKQVNSAYIDDRIHRYGHVHLGIAVALEQGLVVPVVRYAESTSVLELSRRIKTLAAQAREGTLGMEEVQGSTFSITNLGAYGIDFFTPVLNPPEAGILGVGAVQETPVFIGEEVQRRSILPLSLTFDHRVLDGAPAAEYLYTLRKYLEEPYRMLL